jgi:hypothetical protein
MAQQTAVEWFWRWINDNQEATIKQGNQAFEQAKAMEKEQSYNNGHKEMKVVIQVDEDTILNTPNDAALGGIVRNLFYEVKGKQHGKS